MNIGTVGAEQFLGAVDGKLFNDIHVLAAAVVAFAGIALGIFVGQLRALSLHHWPRDIILGGNQFDVIFLAAVLSLDGGPQFGVGLGEGDLFGEHEEGP